MHMSSIISITVLLLLCLQTGCAATQTPAISLARHPLEETKAVAIIEDVLSKRGYRFERGETVRVSDFTSFEVDYRVTGEAMAIEFVTAPDRATRGPAPKPDESSRLHVLVGASSSPTEGGRSRRVYVLFIDDRDFSYQTATDGDNENVTFLEVDSRLRRDLEDFLSWYESAVKKR